MSRRDELRNRWTRLLLVSSSLCLVGSLLTGCDTLRVQRPLQPVAAVLMEGGMGTHPRPHVADEAPAPPLETAWRYNAEGAFGPAPALVAGDRLLVATRNGEVHLVDIESGDRLGKTSLGDAIEGAPVLLDGRLLIVPVAAGKYGLVAYDLVEGRRAWTRRDDLHAAGLVVAGGVLVAAAYDGTVRGLAPRAGTEQWSLRPDSLATYFATPTLLASGHVAVADDRGRVTALEPATGRVVWTAEVGAPVHETPASAEGLLVVPTTRGFVVALDAETGAERWRHLAGGSDVLFAAPAVASGAVLVGASDGLLRRLDPASGAVVWSHGFDGNVAAAPLVAGETVYVGTLDQRLAALDLATGNERWSTELAGRVKSASVASDGTLIVLAEPHYLHAFRAAAVQRAGGVASR